jgi:hypothetical protein
VRHDPDVGQSSDAPTGTVDDWPVEPHQLSSAHYEPEGVFPGALLPLVFENRLLVFFLFFLHIILNFTVFLASSHFSAYKASVVSLAL